MSGGDGGEGLIAGLNRDAEARDSMSSLQGLRSLKNVRYVPGSPERRGWRGQITWRTVVLGKEKAVDMIVRRTVLTAVGDLEVPARFPLSRRQ
jgi:hypothetical protein